MKSIKYRFMIVVLQFVIEQTDYEFLKNDCRALIDDIDQKLEG